MKKQKETNHSDSYELSRLIMADRLVQWSKVKSILRLHLLSFIDEDKLEEIFDNTEPYILEGKELETEDDEEYDE